MFRSVLKGVAVDVFANLIRTYTKACFPALVFIYSNSLNLWIGTFLEPSCVMNCKHPAESLAIDCKFMCDVDPLLIDHLCSDRKPLVPYRFCFIAEYFKPKIRLYYKGNFKEKIALKQMLCEVVDDFTELNLFCFFY